MFHSRIFTTLKFQESPKVYWLERLLGKSIFLFLNKRTIELKTPPKLKNNAQVVIRLRGEEVILFEQAEPDTIKVFRNKEGAWLEEQFYGYPVIEKYTQEELNLKFEKVESILVDNITKCLSNGKCMHGDFTHFNALISSSNVACYIDDDNETASKSVHYDFIHFMVYLVQGIYRTTSLRNNQKKQEIQRLINLFFNLNKTYFNSTIKAVDLERELAQAPGIQPDTFEEVLSFFN